MDAFINPADDEHLLENPQANPQVAQTITSVNASADENARQKPAARQPGRAPESSTGRGMWRIFVFLFKLTLTLVILGALAAAVYFGLPIVYNQYILPVQNNTIRVNGLEISQQRINEQLAAVQTQQAGAVSGEAQLTGQIADLGTRLGALEVEIANHTTSLTALDKMQSTLETDNKQINSTLDRQIKLLKGMELLSRARLFLYQSNFGLAKQDIQSARAIFAAMQTSAPELESKDLAEVVNRLDLAIARLPEFPVVASDDLDIVWQLLLQGIPQIPTMTATFTVTPEPTVTLGATVTPASSATPTATATP
jgi:hypothetical protein